MSAEPELRVPPHSAAAEQSVLGGLLLDNDAWHAIDVTEADFYRREHAQTFRAIGSLIAENRPADVVTVFERLQILGCADDCGGLVYLNALAQSVPSAAHSRRYAEIVRERADMRRLIAATDDAARAAWETDLPFDVRFDRALGAISAAARAGAAPSLPQVVAERLSRYDAIAAGTLNPGWRTSLPTLDRALGGGMEPGRVYIVAARPGVGKSSLASHLALRYAHDGHPVVFVSIEMTGGQVVDRMLASMSSLDYGLIHAGKLDPRDRPALIDAAKRLSALPITIDDKCSSIGATLTAARRIRGCAVLVVDYVQLLQADRPLQSRNYEVADITRRLKRFAVDANVVVIGLAQLNREVETRPDARPRLSDLRDSGAIEQDADAVLMLWRARELDRPGQHLTGLAVAKNREGEMPAFALHFNALRHQWAESIEPLNRNDEPAKARL